MVVILKNKCNWCMCMSLHAHNKLVIKDKFHIPIIFELLDELHGERLFTKLDICFGYH